LPGYAGVGYIRIEMVIKGIDLLEKLYYNKQLTFAYLTCERLYPNYVHFSRKFEFGDEVILRSAIDFIYNSLLIPISPNQKDVEWHLNQVELNTPNTEDFSTILVSSALDSCTAILEALDFILDKETSRLRSISSFATDTVDMFIQYRDDLDFNSDPQFDQKIFNDPLMQREINAQEGIISYLREIDILEPMDITNLLSFQNNDDKSNIDL